MGDTVLTRATYREGTNQDALICHMNFESATLPIVDLEYKLYV